MSATTRSKPETKTLIAAGVPAAPPLPDDLEALLRRLRLPHIRRHAPEVLATAKEHNNVPAGVREQGRGNETVVPGADHDRVRRARRTRRQAAHGIGRDTAAGA